ncbi:MAG TPA: glutamate racemase [Candidatus Kapabacteria bacterium]|nr:glutamate racemase [Candidatus Kapabacteria bacterium]
MDINSSIGIFDSGLGGLSVLKQFIRFLPNEKYIYLGDTARVPYGNKSKSTVERYARECADFLIQKNVKLIVIACSTVSSLAIDTIIEIAGTIPVIGMIKPGANAALRSTKSGKIGVIGTRATISSMAYKTEIEHLNNNKKIEVLGQPCPLFVPFVEEGIINSDAIIQVAKEYLEPLKSHKVDTLILGCTHYPLLWNVIHHLLPDVNLIDTGEHASVSSLRLLAEMKLLKDESGVFVDKPEIDFYVSDLPHNFHQQANIFLGFNVDKPILVELG